MASYPVTTPVIEMPPPTTTASARSAGYTHAELLELSRRIDWRFLLPDPEFGRVAYLGDENKSLTHSLEVFSQSLTRLIASGIIGDRFGHDEGFDLAVIKNPSQGTIQLASALLKPGGTVYLEAHGWLQAARSRRLSRAVSHPRLIRLLQAGGLIVEATHWHWPNFEACTRLIPLDHPNPLLLALASGNGIEALLRQAITRKWVTPRQLASFVPCFSIIARKEAA